MLIDNPAFGARGPRTPRPLLPVCHDRSPLLTIQCACGAELHVHETQLPSDPSVAVGCPCRGCGEVLLFEPGRLQEAFGEMRGRGWIT
jgi:hypothetical protein